MVTGFHPGISPPPASGIISSACRSQFSSLPRDSRRGSACLQRWVKNTQACPVQKCWLLNCWTKGREDGQYFFFQSYPRGVLLELRNYLVSRMIFTDNSGFSIPYQIYDSKLPVLYITKTLWLYIKYKCLRWLASSIIFPVFQGFHRDVRAVRGWL